MDNECKAEWIDLGRVSTNTLGGALPGAEEILNLNGDGLSND
ncbi:hypothetical protein [Novosphingobium rosa]|nr:hypothetical protein [Novosphingobium rosa]